MIGAVIAVRQNHRRRAQDKQSGESHLGLARHFSSPCPIDWRVALPTKISGLAGVLIGGRRPSPRAQAPFARRLSKTSKEDGLLSVALGRPSSDVAADSTLRFAQSQ